MFVRLTCENVARVTEGAGQSSLLDLDDLFVLSVHIHSVKLSLPDISKTSSLAISVPSLPPTSDM